MRRTSGALWAVGGLALVVLGADPAGAQISGPCEATIAGESVDVAASPGDAIEVDAADDVVAAASSGETIETYEIDLEFGGFRWTVASGDAEDNRWEETVEVSDYATFGVGLYKVHGVSFAGGAEVCSGTAYVDVGGKSPLATVAGAGGAAALVGGVALMGIAGFRR